MTVCSHQLIWKSQNLILMVFVSIWLIIMTCWYIWSYMVQGPYIDPYFSVLNYRFLFFLFRLFNVLIQLRMHLISHWRTFDSINVWPGQFDSIFDRTGPICETLYQKGYVKIKIQSNHAYLPYMYQLVVVKNWSYEVDVSVRYSLE